MKTAAEKSSVTASRAQQSSGTFFAGAKGGDFFAPAIQTKLKVGEPGDKFEREADRMADQVVNRQAPAEKPGKCADCEEKEKIQRQPLANRITPFIQKQAEKEELPVQKQEEEEEPVQARLIQRQEEKEEPVQKKAIQRQEEKEEPVQEKAIQRQEEKEEPVQARLIRRQEEEEEPVQEKAIQRQEEKEEPVQARLIRRQEEKEEAVQQKSAIETPGPPAAAIEGVLQGSKGRGSKLPDFARREMEAGFGLDLSEVRIHTDFAAEDMNKALHAQAFTNGWDVYFNAGKFSPGTREGKLLLAHELTHTIQQAKANGKNLTPATSRLQEEIPQPKPANLEAVENEAKKAIEEIGQKTAKETAEPQAPPAEKPEKAPTSKGKSKPKADLSCKPNEAKKPEPPAAAGDAKETPPRPEPAEQAPKCAAADPDFAKAKKQIKQTARQQGSHEPAGQKRDEMVASAAMTTAEQQVQSGQDQQAANLEQAAQPKPFDRFEFKKKLKEKIESKMPDTEEQANDFAGSGKLEEAKEEFKGTISEEKGKVSGPLEQTAATPLPEGQNLKPDNVAVPAAKPAARLAAVPTGLAAPKPRTDEEISLQHESDNLDHQMAKEGLSEKQMEEWEETEEPKPLTAKKDAQREIAAAPGQYRQIEEQKLAEDQTRADKKTGSKLNGMAATKNKKGNEVFGGQKKKETETEKRQREIKAEIDRIYTDTEKEVLAILDALAETVQNTFATEVESANETFKSRVRERLDDHYGWFTFDDKIAEWAGLSDGVAHIFREEKERFLATMDTVLDGIATTVETELNRALARIQQGRTDLDNFKKTLNTDELKFADDLLAEAMDKFTELESTVNESQEELIETLSDQYVDSVNKLQEEFDKINEELSASWIADALSFIGEVATAIKKLGELLSSIASRIGQYISEILDSPKRFFNNLVDGIKGGMSAFEEKIDTYLEQGFWMWLTGASSARNIQIPEKMDVQGMFNLAAQMLGLDKLFVLERIKLKLGKGVLELINRAEAVGEKLLEPVRILFNEGIGALWAWVKNEVSSHLTEIFNKIKEEIFQAIIKKFLLWVAQLFIPGLGFIKLIQAAYKALRWLVDNIDRIVEIVNSFLDAIGLAVQGNVSAIKEKIVKALTLGVVVAIDFLAKLVGLGNFADKLQRAIQSLKKPIQKVLDALLLKAKPVIRKIRRAIAKVVKKVKAGVKKVKAGAKKLKEKILNWWKSKKKIKAANGETHSIYFEGKPENASFMIRSTPQKYTTFVKNIAASPADKQTLTDLAKEIDRRLAQYKQLPQQQRQQWGVELVNLMNQVGVLTEKYAFKEPGKPHTVITWDSPNKEGFGVGFNAKLLSKNYVKGDPAKKENRAVYGWDIARSRKMISMKGKESHVYVKGHLLNENLGGKANVTNLTPITITANNEHKTEVENKVKDIVLTKSKAKGAGVANYEVQALYHKHPNRADLKNRFYKRVSRIDMEVSDLERQNVSAKDARLKKLQQERADLIELVLLLDYEEHEIATALICKWQKMTWDNTSQTWIPDPATPEQFVPIENKIPDDIGGYNFIVRQFTSENL